MDNILITTGDLKEDYEIIDAIFAIDSCSQTLFNGADASKAFDKTKSALRAKCNSLGGHAVINCQFEYRIAMSQKGFGTKQVIEIFSYGTAVRLR